MGTSKSTCFLSLDESTTKEKLVEMANTRLLLRNVPTFKSQASRFLAAASIKSYNDKVLVRLKSHQVLTLDGRNKPSDETISFDGPIESLNLEDFENAFKVKTTPEIIRALAVYKICSFDFIVNRNEEVKITKIVFFRFFISLYLGKLWRFIGNKITTGVLSNNY